jgi:hypothetical protein
MSSLPGVYVHTAPSIASDIADTLQSNDFVRLISDHPDLGWVEVATRSGRQGWVKRSLVDFSRAIKSRSPNFSLGDTLTPTPSQTPPPLTLSIQLRKGDNSPKKVLAAGKAQSCGEAIQNGDFEAGSVSWVEESAGYIIRNDWDDPHQGSWVAWLGGIDAQEKLTQLFHVPVDVQDAQTFKFYLKVTTQETGDQVYDTFDLRFLDAGGNPISSDIRIADNTTPTDWLNIFVNLTGMTSIADRDIQVQFECVTDSSNDTNFVIDSVSLDLICRALYYVYLPVIARAPTPTPTDAPTPTLTPSATPCPSYNPCPSDCGYDCPSDCSSDCPTDYCSSDCVFDCIYYCPFDCIYDCSYHW